MNVIIGLIIVTLLVLVNVLMVVFIVTGKKTIRMMKCKGQYRLCNDGLYHWREDPNLHPVIKDIEEAGSKQ